MHLDCTKIYLLVLMVACRHRHASVKVVGIQRDFQERLFACRSFVPTSNSKRVVNRKELINFESDQTYTHDVVSALSSKYQLNKKIRGNKSTLYFASGANTLGKRADAITFVNALCYISPSVLK